MTELHIELKDMTSEKALYYASLAHVKKAGFLCSDVLMSKEQVAEKKESLQKLALFYDIDVFLGFKICFIPPALIESYAEQAREKGFDYICVHGENIYEHVPQGTNFAAVNAEVDVLLNAGIIDKKLIEFAEEKDIFFEFNLNPFYASANALLADYAQNHEIKLLLANSIESEKDFLYSMRAEESIKIYPQARNYDLIKKLNQDTSLFIQKLTKK